MAISPIHRAVLINNQVTHLSQKLSDLQTLENRCKAQVDQTTLALVNKGVKLGIPIGESKLQEYISNETNPHKKSAAIEIFQAACWIYSPSRALDMQPSCKDVWECCVKLKSVTARYEHVNKLQLQKVGLEMLPLYIEVELKLLELKEEFEMLVDLSLILSDPAWNPKRRTLTTSLKGYEEAYMW